MSAYTMSELGDYLPHQIGIEVKPEEKYYLGPGDKRFQTLRISKFGDIWDLAYVDSGPDFPDPMLIMQQSGYNLAEIIGWRLLHLRENNLIELPK